MHNINKHSLSLYSDKKMCVFVYFFLITLTSISLYNNNIKN